jgi:tRNA threonylcarbamoyladenosine biosynthesis protein TsaE
MLKLQTNSPEETTRLGVEIGKLLNGDDIVCLQGDLGAGKTYLAKGILKGLGVTERVTTPTYNIINEYRGRLFAYHIDLYRISDYRDLYDTSFRECIYSGGVAIIEWADKADSLIPDSYLNISIKGEDNQRIVKIIPQSNKYLALIMALKKEDCKLSKRFS